MMASEATSVDPGVTSAPAGLSPADSVPSGPSGTDTASSSQRERVDINFTPNSSARLDQMFEEVSAINNKLENENLTEEEIMKFEEQKQMLKSELPELREIDIRSDNERAEERAKLREEDARLQEQGRALEKKNKELKAKISLNQFYLDRQKQEQRRRNGEFEDYNEEDDRPITIY